MRAKHALELGAFYGQAARLLTRDQVALWLILAHDGHDPDFPFVVGVTVGEYRNFKGAAQPKPAEAQSLTEHTTTMPDDGR